MERSGRECVLFTMPRTGARGFHLHSYNDVIGNSLEVMAPTFSSAFAQLAAEDDLEYVSGEAADTTQTIEVYGIDSSGKKARDSQALNGTTVVTSGVEFRYVENAWIDAEAAGIITIRRATGDTFIAEVEIGAINTGIAQHFNGEAESYVTFFAAGLYDGTWDATFELRWYPDDADCLDPTDGFEVLDRLYCPVESGHDSHPYPMPIGPLPKGGWLVVYAIAEADSAKGWVTVQGFDVEVPTNY